jgi:hypothetical protein
VATSEEVVLRRLYWVGPLTIAAAIGAVAAVQQISLWVLRDLPAFSDNVLHSKEPAYATLVFVGGAVLIFPIIVDAAQNPLRMHSVAWAVTTTMLTRLTVRAV